jgi:hypothetical protein
MSTGMQDYQYRNAMLRPGHWPWLSGKYLKVRFTPDEDARLTDLVDEYGTNDWGAVALAMQTRNARQCRERYKNYLDPALRTDWWTAEEDALLQRKYDELGAKWNRISKFFKNRPDNALRNRWRLLDRHRRPSSECDDDVPVATAKDDGFDIFNPPRADARLDGDEGDEPSAFDL